LQSNHSRLCHFLAILRLDDATSTEEIRAVRKPILSLMLAAAAVAFAATTPAAAEPAELLNIAVFGDSPYGTTPTDTAQVLATPAFIESINADPSVSLVLHVGDIHSGKQFCTLTYDQSIYDFWTAFQRPLVYTPGDNEWSDCHKTGEGGGAYNATTGQIAYKVDASGNLIDYAGGNPIANLNLVRSIFFADPGHTLGRSKFVLTQAWLHDPAFPSDGNYVENVMWVQSGVLFVTVNIPGGSNNDQDIWYGIPTMSTAQAQEVSERTGADIRWLNAAFAVARAIRVKGLVIQTQADMWDLDGKAATHLTGYEGIIGVIAAKTAEFGKPVLMFNGDSHIYRSDNPLMQGAACVAEPSSGAAATACLSDDWTQHPYYSVPNFHRVVVHGSTLPLEWLKLAVNPRANAPASASAFGPFSWQRMPQ
jgi:hypothetical protein